MHSSEELKVIYESRYKNASDQKGKREIVLYQKYRKLLVSKKFQTNVHLLDLGCGIGYKTVGFSLPNESILAIDLSENAINFCISQHQIDKVDFKAMDAFEVTGKFELITAFGFSLFNTHNNDRFIEVLKHFYTNNLSKEKGNMILIGSFTDFSGGGKDSWYLHTKSDIEYIQKKIEAQFPLKVNIVFPHKMISNYFGFGFYNFVAEILKLIIKRKRTFFIRIEHE